MALSTVNKFYLLVLILGFTFPVAGQSYKLIDSCKVNGRYLKVDKLENLYTWDDRGQLIKYGVPASVNFIYDDFTLGPLSQVDVSDPMTPLLFYDDYMTIRILDRTLSLRAELNLNNLGFYEVHCAALSGDKHIWIYDDFANRLFKVGTDGTITSQSQDLRLMLKRAVKGTAILQQNNTIYLFEREKGIHLFDIFGKYIKFLPLENWARAMVIQPGGILLNTPAGCAMYNLNSFLEASFRLPDNTNCTDPFVIRNEKLYRLKDDKVLIYSISE